MLKILRYRKLGLFVHSVSLSQLGIVSPVDFRFTRPRSFIAREENFDRTPLTVPQPPPHFTVAALANTLAQCNLLGQRTLDQQGHTRTTA